MASKKWSAQLLSMPYPPPRGASTFPFLHHLYARWAPVLPRSVFNSRIIDAFPKGRAVYLLLLGVVMISITVMCTEQLALGDHTISTITTITRQAQQSISTTSSTTTITTQAQQSTIVLVTAFSQNHALSVPYLLANAYRYDPQIPRVVYLLGEIHQEEEVWRMLSLAEVEIRHFNFSAHPAWMHVNSSDAGQYAWKPLIVEQMLREYEVVIWTDSGNRWKESLMPFVEYAREHNGLYSGLSWGMFGKYLHRGMFRYYANDTVAQYNRKNSKDKPSCDAAFLVFTQQAARLVEEWALCARNKPCIAPEGSSRANHRQDQAALTFLLYSDKFLVGNGNATRPLFACQNIEYTNNLKRWRDALVPLSEFTTIPVPPTESVVREALVRRWNASCAITPLAVKVAQSVALINQELGVVLVLPNDLHDKETCAVAWALNKSLGVRMAPPQVWLQSGNAVSLPPHLPQGLRLVVVQSSDQRMWINKANVTFGLTIMLQGMVIPP